MNKCESLFDLYNWPPKHINLVVLQNYLFRTHAVNQKAASLFSSPDGSLTHDQLWALALIRQGCSCLADTACPRLFNYGTNTQQLQQSWFPQAADTPFGHGDLFNLVGFEGLTEETDAILRGNCIDYMGGE
jgi:hypothetical protein